MLEAISPFKFYAVYFFYHEHKEYKSGKRFFFVFLYVYYYMILQMKRSLSRTFLFASFSFVETCGNVDNFFLEGCIRCFLTRPCGKIGQETEAVCAQGKMQSPSRRYSLSPVRAVSEKTGHYLGMSTRIKQEWSGNRIQP
jgi:hypothetical protein